MLTKRKIKNKEKNSFIVIHVRQP